MPWTLEQALERAAGKILAAESLCTRQLDLIHRLEAGHRGIEGAAQLLLLLEDSLRLFRLHQARLQSWDGKR